MPQVMPSTNSGLSSPLYLEVPNCSPINTHYPLDSFAMNNKNVMDINSFYENLSNLNAFHTLAESFNYFYDRQQSRPEPKYSPAKSFSIESILGSPASVTSSSVGGDELVVPVLSQPVDTQFSALLPESGLSSFPHQGKSMFAHFTFDYFFVSNQ